MQKWPTSKHLNSILRQWQIMLRLQHWKISIRYANAREMSSDIGSIAWGRCRVFENCFKADLQILRPEDYADDEGREEIEHTVVHELLHVVMHAMRSTAKDLDAHGDIGEEQAINVIADTLVGLRRQSEE